MIRVLLFVLLFVFRLIAEDKEYLFSTEIQVSKAAQFLQNDAASLSELEGLPNSIVFGHVDVITGSFFDMQTDLDLGEFGLNLARSFTSNDSTRGSIAFGWSHNHSQVVNTESQTRHRYAVTKGRLGGEYLYRGCLHGYTLTLDPKNFEKGVTNCHGPLISARTNVKNHLLKKLGNREYELQTGSNALMKFERFSNSKDLYHIVSQLLPSGGEVAYQYDTNENCIWKVIKKNTSGKEISQLKFSFPSKDDLKYFAKNKKKGAVRPEIRITAPDGRKVKYTLDVFCGGSLPNNKGEEVDYYRARVVKVSRPSAPKESYQYSEPSRFGLEQIMRKEGPDGRFLAVDYHIGTSKFQHGKVKCIKCPNGSDSSPVALYSFFYEDGKDHQAKTVVTDGLGHRTIYSYSSKSNLLSTIERFHGRVPYSLQSKECFEWGVGSHTGNLISRKIYGSEGNLCFERSYQYDEKGNVLKNSTKGSFTGKQALEEYNKTFTYSKDGRNLLLSMSDGEIKESYRYEKDKDLLIAKFTSVEGSPFEKREFFEYDENGAITLKIIDDGSVKSKNDLTGVTERHIERFINRKELPVGLPEICEELYLDIETGQEKLLKRRVCQYDAFGNLINEKIFDAEGEYCFEQLFEYNGFGKVTLAINAQNERTVYSYDANGNLISEHGPRPNIVKNYTYDLANRCVRKEIKDGASNFTESYRYDVMGQKICSIDIAGNETKYHYDAFGNLSEIAYPVIQNQPELKEFREYDLFGNVCLSIDQAHGKTSILPNLRGQPLRIEHPDGSIETFEYSLKGDVVSHVTASKAMTKTTYDVFSRPILEEIYLADGTCHSQVQKFYNHFHLLKEIAADGLVTEYSYDGAGRMIKLAKGDFIQTFSYDALGRKIEEKLEGVQTKKIAYDVLDRIAEESFFNIDGHCQSKIGYVYDEEGNRTQIIKQNEAGSSTQYFNYDALNRVIKSTDQLNHCTSIFYDTAFGFKKTVVDPKGNQIIVIYDALNYESEISHKNALGEILKKEAYAYDEKGNRTVKIETVICQANDDRQPNKESVTLFSYDEMNRLTQTVEAAHTPHERTLKRTYDIAGRLISLTKADGITFKYAYDALNRLIEYFSSDGSVHYRLTYNLANEIVKADDLVNKTSTSRAFDANRHLVSEKHANGLSLNYERDSLDRVSKLIYPDHSYVLYSYDGSRLMKVEKFSKDGELQYAHRYSVYDLSSNLIEEELIGGIGKVNYAYDLLNRVTQIVSPYGSESNRVFDQNGNLISRNVQTTLFEYDYDDLDQLTKERGSFSNDFVNDSRHNQVVVNGNTQVINEADQLEEVYHYDKNGNVIQSLDSIFEYDALDRLIKVITADKTINYRYDAFHRRIEKQADSTVKYFYSADNELGALDETEIELRVLGRSLIPRLATAVAIELNGRVFAPLHDSQGNVTTLIDIQTKDVAEQISYSAYGQEATASPLSPWRLAGKRLDKDTGLVHYGARDYDPVHMRWTTLDPVLASFGNNRYNYLENNPFKYTDPDGRFAFALPVLVWGAAEGVCCAITGAGIAQALAATALGAYCCYEANKIDGPRALRPLFGVYSYFIQALMEGIVVGTPEAIEVAPDVEGYAPDRKLPTRPKGPREGEPMPEVEDAAHTVLGTKVGGQGKYKYVQGMEYGSQGKRIKRIDFHDHNRPHDHTNPHQHRFTESKTGGTFKIEPAEPLTEWNY